MLQKIGISKSLHVLDEAIKEMINDIGFPKCFKIADLGCSSGPNSLSVISRIIEKIEHLSKENNNEYEVFLSDLHGNDFNNLFKILPDFYEKLNINNPSTKCFVSGLPGSFYGRLFPSNSLDFVHSSFSLHWLSRTPEGLESNKDNIHIANTSPPEILEAYIKQHRKDFSAFLSSRGEEMVRGGRMVLTFVGGRLKDHASLKQDQTIPISLMAKTLAEMVGEGVIKEADLHSFNLPVYPPTKEQVEEIVRSEGSFALNELEEFVLPWDVHVTSSANLDKYGWGKLVTNFIRAFLEPTLASHFGSSLMNEVFERYGNKIVEVDSKEIPPMANMVISLTKK
ncbi:hypothetical protein ACP275_14G163900 [Erythranthe tilingii]